MLSDIQNSKTQTYSIIYLSLNDLVCEKILNLKNQLYG